MTPIQRVWVFVVKLVAVSRNTSQSPTDALLANWKSGLVLGIVMYILGYAATYASMVSDGVDYSLDGVSFAKEVGWVFYASQMVDLEVSGPGVSETVQIFSGNNVPQLTSSVPEIAYRAFPVILLIVAGFVLCQRGKNKQTTTISAAVIGATVTIGYLSLVVLGQSFFKYSQSGSEVIAQPPLVSSVLIIGLIYPIVFGGIGGALANVGS